MHPGILALVATVAGSSQSMHSIRLASTTRLRAVKHVAALDGPQTSATASPIAIALFPFAFYGAHANSIEPGDTAMGQIGTAALRLNLEHFSGLQLIDSTTLAKAVAQPGPQDSANGKLCNVRIACARTAAHLAGAAWAITGTISKTSNLIWIFSGQLINTATGELVLDDEYELKGDSHDMVVHGARVFAGRVAKKLGITAPAPATPQS